MRVCVSVCVALLRNTHVGTGVLEVWDQREARSVSSLQSQRHLPPLQRLSASDSDCRKGWTCIWRHRSEDIAKWNYDFSEEKRKGPAVFHCECGWHHFVIALVNFCA